MSVVSNNVLKKERVRMVDASHFDSAEQALPGHAQSPRVIQEDRHGTLVEMTCSCGEIIRLYCRFPEERS